MLLAFLQKKELGALLYSSMDRICDISLSDALEDEDKETAAKGIKILCRKVGRIMFARSIIIHNRPRT